MPPRSRTRGAKAFNENADVKNTGILAKSTRKALADKTNSLSDNNETVCEIEKVTTKVSLAIENNGRPRRQKRLPGRYKENRVLNDLPTCQTNSSTSTKEITKTAKKVIGKENNLKTSKTLTSDPPINKNKTSSKLRNGIKKRCPLIKGLPTQAHDTSILKQSLRSRNTKYIALENISKNANVVHGKNENVTHSKRKIPEKKQTVCHKKIKTKPTDTKKDTSELKDKSNNSKSSFKLNISYTFTPPSKKEPALEKSLFINRPKRIHRLPSRFDDHSISPNKFIPVQPCHASTPLQKKYTKTMKQFENKETSCEKGKGDSPKSDKDLLNKSSPDSNNNPKNVRPTRLRVNPKTSPIKSPKKFNIGKRLLDKSLSFKILEDNNKPKNDVYEFTFDSDEEPQQQKKKRKRVVKKNPSKPKTVRFKNNYDKNISKAMAALKDAVAKHVHPKAENKKSEAQKRYIVNAPKQTLVENTQVQREEEEQTNAQTDFNAQPQKSGFVNSTPVTQIVNQSQYNVNDNINMPSTSMGNKSVYENLPSIRVEDIEADCEISYHDNINYSPLNSPRPSSLNPMAVTQHCNAENRRETIEEAIHSKDPLNLQDDISFFDDQPVASSSMNVSVRHPLASPWRVEFGSLPIRWQANTYLKPNMTPAVDNSFISSEDNHKKKHVYVNMVPETNESLPQIIDNTPSHLKQTSIISFIKEVAEKNAKKKRGKSVSPVKACALFEDITNKINDHITISKKPSHNEIIGETATKNVSDSKNITEDKENVRVTRKRRNENNVTKLSAKSPCKEKHKNVTYFGFDDSENLDEENVLPKKKIDSNRVKALRSRSRILQELNDQREPSRAALSLAEKNKITSSSEAVKKIYKDMKSAQDAPQFLDKDDQQNAGTTNVDICYNVDNDSAEGESVHLFEDIDVVHHLKPTRKSYGKAKKVTFRQRSTSDSETQASDADNHAHSNDEDDLADLTFTMPEINQKKTVRKKKAKKLMSKKEEKEADEWAAGFNSMCEDIEEFPLVVE